MQAMIIAGALAEQIMPVTAPMKAPSIAASRAVDATAKMIVAIRSMGRRMTKIAKIIGNIGPTKVKKAQMPIYCRHPKCPG